MSEHPLDGPAVEQIARILERGQQAVVRLTHDQRKGELRRTALEHDVAHPQIGKGALSTTRSLEREEHLGERRMTELPTWVDCSDQLLERKLLVLIGSERRLPHPGDKLAETRIPGKVDPQRQRVYEEPDHFVELGPRPVCDRSSDNEILLAAVSPHERAERRQQQHEQGGVLLERTLLQPSRQRSRKQPPPVPSAVALRRRRRPIRGQLEPRRSRRQPTAPIGEQLVEPLTRQPLVLPDREVRVLQR